MAAFSDILNVKEGINYYAKETKAPKGFELNPEVIGPLKVDASNSPGVFQAVDNPKPTTGSGKLQKQSANPEITNGNSYYSLEGAEYTVYSDAQLKKSVAVLKTDKNGNLPSGHLPSLGLGFLSLFCISTRGAVEDRN